MGLVYHLSTHDNGRATLGFAFEGVPTVSQRVTRAHLASVRRRTARGERARAGTLHA